MVNKIVIFIGVVWLAVMSAMFSVYMCQKNIVNHGHGVYNETTGKFEFLPKCNK